MAEATREFLKPSQWKKQLETSPSFQTTSRSLRDLYISCVMHMGMKSLELLVPGGVEKLKMDMERIADGIRMSVDADENELEAVDTRDRAERLLKVVGDPWLWSAYPTLQSDLWFTLWTSCHWPADKEDLNTDSLIEAIRSPPQKKHTQST